MTVESVARVAPGSASTTAPQRKRAWGVIVIVSAIAILALVAIFTIVAQQPVAYRSDDSAEAAVHNYLLAVLREDYDRAYSYVSETAPGYPADAATLQDDLQSGRPFRRGPLTEAHNAFSIDGSAQMSDGSFRVWIVRYEYYDGDMFGGTPYDVRSFYTVERVDGAWKLTEGDWAWPSDWSN